MAGIPVGIELRRYLVYHRANSQNIEIVEVKVRTRAEVLVRNVTATDNGDMVVEGDLLVVHAVIDTLKLIQVSELGNTRGKRVYQPDFKVRIGFQYGESLLVAFG